MSSNQDNLVLNPKVLIIKLLICNLNAPLVLWTIVFLTSIIGSSTILVKYHRDDNSVAYEVIDSFTSVTFYSHGECKFVGPTGGSIGCIDKTVGSDISLYGKE